MKLYIWEAHQLPLKTWTRINSLEHKSGAFVPDTIIVMANNLNEARIKAKEAWAEEYEDNELTSSFNKPFILMIAVEPASIIKEPKAYLIFGD